MTFSEPTERNQLLAAPIVSPGQATEGNELATEFIPIILPRHGTAGHPGFVNLVPNEICLEFLQEF